MAFVKWNYRIATVMGIPIRIHLSLLAFLPILAWRLGSREYILTWAAVVNTVSPHAIDANQLLSDTTPWLIGIAGAIGLFVGVAIHELGHSWVARRYGLTIDSITLWLFGGVAQIKDLPTDWKQEFWIAIAGPITSVLVGIIAYALLWGIPSELAAVVFVFGWLALTNISLAIFNLLPAFPMDGGRILRSILARSRPFVQATRTAVGVAKVIAALLALIAVLSLNILLLLLAGFVYLAATSEATLVITRDLLSDIPVRTLLRPEMNTVRAGTPVGELINKMLVERRTEYIVTDDAGNVLGVVTLSNIQHVSMDVGTTVDEIMTEDPPTISIDADAFELFRTLGEADSDCVLVEEDGRVSGLISHLDFVQMLTLLQGTRKLTSEMPDHTEKHVGKS